MEISTLGMLLASLLLIVSIVMSKTSLKMGVPALVMFLVLGMLAGEDGLGYEFDDALMAQSFGNIALSVILFYGGLNTKFQSIKPVMAEGVSLATFGVLLTCVAVGGFVYLVSGFTLLESLLLGAVVSSTDAAAVFSIFKTRKVALKRRLKDVIELESASNDPMASILTITLVALIQAPGTTWWSILLQFVAQMLVGLMSGALFGWLSVKFINRVKLDFAGLYPVLLIGLNIFIYATTTYLHGNGFLAIYIAAVMIGNSAIEHKRSMLTFYDGFAWLMQIVMFLMLGLLVTPSTMLEYAGIGLAVSAFIILAARPLAVFASLLPFTKMKALDKLFVSWCGLRGAVPIVFATYPMLAGVEAADAIFNIVFYITLTSMLIQGTTFSRVARWMGLSLHDDDQGTFIFNEQDDFNSELQEIDLANPDCDGQPIMSLGLPEGALVVYVKRGKQYITPRGNTEVKAGDKLLVMSNDAETMKVAKNLLSGDTKNG